MTYVATIFVSTQVVIKIECRDIVTLKIAAPPIRTLDLRGVARLSIAQLQVSVLHHIYIKYSRLFYDNNNARYFPDAFSRFSEILQSRNIRENKILPFRWAPFEQFSDQSGTSGPYWKICYHPYKLAIKLNRKARWLARYFLYCSNYTVPLGLPAPAKRILDPPNPSGMKRRSFRDENSVDRDYLTRKKKLYLPGAWVHRNMQYFCPAPAAFCLYDQLMVSISHAGVLRFCSVKQEHFFQSYGAKCIANRTRKRREEGGEEGETHTLCTYRRAKEKELFRVQTLSPDIDSPFF